MGTTKSKRSTRTTIVLGGLMVFSAIKAIGPLNEDGDNHPSENEHDRPERKGLTFGKANTFLSCCQLIALSGHRDKGSMSLTRFRGYVDHSFVSICHTRT